MEEERRRAYLMAMGISLWERRLIPVAPATRPDQAQSSAPELSLTSVSVPQIPQAPIAIVSPAGLGAEPQCDPEPMDTAGTPWLNSATPEVQRRFVVPTQADDLDWATLESTVRSCRACRLWETRTQVVFGVGDCQAQLMVIGEAPGADEDARGEPFVGRAGQLLNLMLKSIGLMRDQIYIANVLKCRPPGNRDPRPDEALACQGYLRRQIELVAPRVILAVGRISAQHLLQTDAPLNRLRGRWFDYEPGRIPLRVTYHPAYLLRSPDQKAKAWDDLSAVKRRLLELAAGRSAQAEPLTGHLDQLYL